MCKRRTQELHTTRQDHSHQQNRGDNEGKTKKNNKKPTFGTFSLYLSFTKTGEGLVNGACLRVTTPPYYKSWFGPMTPPGHLLGRHSHMSILEETLGQNCNMLRDNVQGTPPGSSGGAGGSHWGEDYLGLPVEDGTL